MGMTIAKPIQTLEYLRDSGVFPFSTKEGVLYTAESIDVAVDTMRKYQKIEQVMDELNGNFYGSYLKDRQALEKIYEVVEDGKETRFS